MIVGVAIRHRRNREVFSMKSPARHDTAILFLASNGHGEHAEGIQGFVTEAGQFLTREEALQHVKDCRQSTTGQLCGSILFSEDLW